MATSTLPRFLSGMLATGIGSLSVIVMGIMGFMLTARLLPTDELGSFFILQALVIFACQGTSIGIYAALERFLSGATIPSRQQRILSTAFYVRIATATFMAVVILIVSEPLFRILGLSVSPFIIALFVIWFMLEALLGLVFSHHQARFAFRTIGVANVLSSTVNFAAILLLVLGMQQGLLGLLYAKLLSRLLALSYAWAACPLRIVARVDLPLLRLMLRYSLPLYANYFLSFLSTRADTLLIGWLLGTGPVAYYEVARRIPESLDQLYTSFRQVYVPFVARSAAKREADRISALINHSTRFGALGLSFGCLIAFAFDREIMVLLFSETYSVSALPFALLMLAVSLLMIESTLGSTLAAIGDSDKPLIINIVRTTLLLTAYVFLIPAIGIVGAALAAVVAAAAVIPVNVYFLRRRGLTVLPDGYTKPLLISAGLVLVLWATAPMVGTLTEIVIVLAYLPAALLWSVVKPSELAVAMHWIREMPQSGLRLPPVGRADETSSDPAAATPLRSASKQRGTD